MLTIHLQTQLEPKPDITVTLPGVLNCQRRSLTSAVNFYFLRNFSATRQGTIVMPESHCAKSTSLESFEISREGVVVPCNLPYGESFIAVGSYAFAGFRLVISSMPFLLAGMLWDSLHLSDP